MSQTDLCHSGTEHYIKRDPNTKTQTCYIVLNMFLKKFIKVILIHNVFPSVILIGIVLYIIGKPGWSPWP